MICSLSLFYFIFTITIVACYTGIPVPAQYFDHQLVDHSAPHSSPYIGQLWSQRYYVLGEHFKGPGSPIFLILGGEGAIEPEQGIFYPFIGERLAKAFGAYVLQPEHRFYGTSQPISSDSIKRARKSGEKDPRVQLFTVEQALHDAVPLVMRVKGDLGCGMSPYDDKYCPVITVGGSCPGFLSALARIMFPTIVDMAYAGSAPMRFYSQEVDPSAYYDHISEVAEKSHLGCTLSVKTTLEDVILTFQSMSEINTTLLGIEEGTVPEYALENVETFLDELFMMVGYTFANDNMAYYPPSNRTRLFRACEVFGSEAPSSVGKLRSFLVESLASANSDSFNMSAQLPTGTKATISSGDWSGVGTGTNGESWDFQTCTQLVEAISYGSNSMFPFRPWTLGWLNKHCQSRFGVTPDPLGLVNRWKIDDMIAAGASRIIFTNGLNDGWSVSGIKNNISDTLLAINFPNGAHHSDLFYRAPSEEDTDDLKAGFVQIQRILASWIEDINTLPVPG